jgi:hypothetical protein
MRITFQVEVELEREQGKFAGREEIVDAIEEWIQMADEGEVEGVGADGESTYTVTSWAVSEVKTNGKK